MLTLIFMIWLFGVTFKLGIFAIRAGWGILRMLLTIVFLPLTILGLLIAGIIQLTLPILVIIGVITIVRMCVRGYRGY